MNDFHHWVSNTVAECGGNYDQCLQGLQRERALTYLETRMNACQGVFDIYFYDHFLGSTPLPTIVTTNNTWIH